MHARHRKKLPTIWLMTDERIDSECLIAAATRLPKGRAGIIFRHHHHDPAARRALFDRLRDIARRRRLLLLLAGSPRQAMAWKADGWHGRSGQKGAAGAGRPLLHSRSAHDVREMKMAERAGADFTFLSPLFATRSHPGARNLGRMSFSRIARIAHQPVMALGGVTWAHRYMLRGIGAYGWGAIDGLVK